MKWTILVVFAIALAGCAGGADTPVESDEFQEASVSATTGGVSGVVVDETITPVAAVEVVLNDGTATTSDEEGRFVFDDLEPGVYFIDATAINYIGAQTSVTVAAGETSKVRIALVYNPVPQPYHETLSFDWFDSAGVTLVDFLIDLTDDTFLGDTLPDACDVCRFYFETNGPVETFVIEGQWQDTVNAPLGDTSYYWTLAHGDDWTNGYEDGYFVSAEPAYVGDNTFGNTTYMQISMSADETWVTVDQRAELFVTTFYLDAAPEGWSFIAGDE